MVVGGDLLMSCGCGYTVVCPPQYIVRDFVTPRVIPVIHPVVTVNRQNVVNVPQHFIQPSSVNVTVAQPGFVGYTGADRLFGRTGFAGGPRFF